MTSVGYSSQDCAASNRIQLLHLKRFGTKTFRKMRSLMKDEKIVRENRLPLIINLPGPYVVNNYFRYREYSFELRNLRQT